MPSPPPLPALQMRFALHAPVQLLNFAAASLLFPAVCHDQLSAAGGPAGHAALQLCLLRLGAKVRLLPAVLRCTPSACWCERGCTLALATRRAVRAAHAVPMLCQLTSSTLCGAGIPLCGGVAPDGTAQDGARGKGRLSAQMGRCQRLRAEGVAGPLAGLLGAAR